MFGYKVIVGTNMGVLLGTSGTLGTWVWQCTRQAVLHHFGSKRRCFHLKLIHPHLFCPFKLLSLSELLRKYLMPPPILINSPLSHLRQFQVVTHFQCVAMDFIFFCKFSRCYEITLIRYWFNDVGNKEQTAHHGKIHKINLWILEIPKAPQNIQGTPPIIPIWINLYDALAFWFRPMNLQRWVVYNIPIWIHNF